MSMELLAAHLTRAHNPHGGDFGHNSSLGTRARQWASALRLRRSRIGAIRLTLVHDEVVEMLDDQQDAAIVLHRLDVSSLPMASIMAPNDLRWLAFERLLEQPPAHLSHDTEDDCVAIVDVSDVGVIGNVTSLCEQHPHAIFAASDACGVGGTRGVKAWMRSQASRANFSLATTPWLRRQLTQRSSVPVVFNCGIAGGRRGVFAPFVRAMASLIRQHYAREEAVAWRLVDMLIFNELVLRRLADTEEALQQPREALRWNHSVVTGWPLGPVNLPMWASFCGQEPQHEASCANPTREKADECVRRLMLRMAPDFYFVHKVFFTFGVTQTRDTRGASSVLGGFAARSTLLFLLAAYVTSTLATAGALPSAPAADAGVDARLPIIIAA